MKRLTNVLLGILIVLLVACSVAAFAACDENPVTEHTHEWADDFTVDKAATCTADGSKSIHCNSCDETKDVTAIPATGHVWASDFTVDIEPDCTQAGSKSKHCTVDGCDGKSEATVVPANGHAWAEAFTTDVEPTCTEEGSKSKHCTVDGCDGKSEVAIIPANGHAWAESYTVDKAATCTEAGSKSRLCTVEGCGAKDEATIPANGHAWADSFTIDKAATCTEQGSKSKHCTVDDCDGKSEVTVIPANGHSWAESFTIDVEPTCTEEGSKSKHCTVDGCDGKSEVTVIPANGHSWAESFTIDVEPTCTEEGSKSKHCTVDGCDGKSEVASIPATGHSATAYPETQSTCSVKGHDAYWQCDTCSKYFSDVACETLIDAPVEHDLLAHTYDSWDSPQYQKASTCTEDGYQQHNICLVCHAKFDINDTALANPISDEDWAANYVLPAKHTSVNTRTVKDPTCTNDGYTTLHYYCSKCKSYAWDKDFTQPMTAADVTSVTITKLGHDYSDEWTIDAEATCAKAGSKSHHCSRCTAKKDTTAIPVLSHTWADEYTVDIEPTCQTAGSKSYHCSVCDASNAESSVEVPISDDSHAWSHRSFVLTPATCISAGSQAKMCLICGAQQDPTVIPVNPDLHNYSIRWTVDAQATCTEAGSMSHHCENEGCDAKGSVTEIPALGHYYEWTVDGTAATGICTNGCDDTKSHTLPDEAEGKTVNNIIETNISAAHYVTRLGANFVDVKLGTYYLDFTADKSGVYYFSFEYLTPTLAVVLRGIQIDGESVASVATIDRVGSVTNSVQIQLNKGETLCLYFLGGKADAKYIVTASLQEEIADTSLAEGDNTVKITEAGDLTGIDSYTFTPTESKRYAMNVPQGLSVAMNNQNFISSGTYAEFEAVAGVAITFSFMHDETGEYEIYIGEASAKILELNAAEMSVTLVGQSMTAFRVGDDLAPGVYTITFSGGFLKDKSSGSGKLWLQLNGGNDFSCLPLDYQPTDNAVYLEFRVNALITEWCECDLNSNSNGSVWKVTLELAAGDVIYLAPDKSNSAGATFSELNIQLTKAA